MLKLLYWNCKGIANLCTKRVLANLVHNHHPDLIFISEPMSSFHSTSSLGLSSFDFDTFHSNSPHLATLNLWCFLNSNHHLATSIFNASSQHLIMLFSNPTSGLSTFITGVYDSTNPTHRKNLWQILINTSPTTLPWCVLGDFNAILAHDEKLSLRQATPSSLKDFQTVVIQADLSDISLSGGKFTWSNNRKGFSIPM
ncbi:hypothetical protein AAC387_Pa11g1346 [Persea americana]